uniref:Uncharacterized protein n=1 Tax=viral metagenome TaxID=1070528 RepID=A0A6C0DR64_9ZZZZ
MLQIILLAVVILFLIYKFVGGERNYLVEFPSNLQDFIEKIRIQYNDSADYLWLKSNMVGNGIHVSNYE